MTLQDDHDNERPSTPEPRPVSPAEHDAAPVPTDPPAATRDEGLDGPLPVCDYTGESDAPCEEPVVQKRWSSVAVVIAAAFGSLVGGLLVAAALVWAFGAIPGIRPVASGSKTTPATSVTERITINPTETDMDVAEAVARKVTPAVVNITVEQKSFDPLTGATGFAVSGSGSGVVIDDKGHVLTNDHVVEGADRIIVNQGPQEKVAKVVGRDPSTDLAVLELPESTGDPIEFGTSDNLKVGQWVMAVGSPFGLEKTVTTGIISALERTSITESISQDNPYGITAYTNLIQTDAAINPGNSGGALVDAQGRLIGINALIQSPSGQMGTPQSAGIGFAIPVDFARSIAQQLIKDGRATHPYFGIRMQTVDALIAQQNDLPVDAGVLVVYVQPDSPAEKAGLQRNDIVVSIDGKPIEGRDEFVAAVRAKTVGDTIEVEVVRADSRRTFDLVLGSDQPTSTP